MFNYRIYGLNVLSNRQLDCYPHEFEDAASDIVLEFTDSEVSAAHYIEELHLDEEPIEISAPDGLGKLFFCGDKHIIVCYQTDDTVKRFWIHTLFGFGFSYLLMKRKIFLIHGSCVLLDGGATILVGSSEAGKSSLAAALVQKGGRLISDDTTRLETNTETPFAYPSYPLRRLYKNTMEHLGLGVESAFEIITKKDKFAFTDNGQKVFLNREVPSKAIVYIAPTDTDEIFLVREQIKNAILIVCRNVFNYKMIKHSEFSATYLDFALEVCSRIPVYTLYRPRNALTVREQADVILSEIYQKDII